MKKGKSTIIGVVIVVYLLIGLGIDSYRDYKLSQTETIIEGIARENNKYSPGHLLRIIFWPFYL